MIGSGEAEIDAVVTPENPVIEFKADIAVNGRTLILIVVLFFIFLTFQGAKFTTFSGNT